VTLHRFRSCASSQAFHRPPSAAGRAPSAGRGTKVRTPQLGQLIDTPLQRTRRPLSRQTPGEGKTSSGNRTQCPPAAPSTQLTALVAAAETITSEVQYASFLTKQAREAERALAAVNRAERESTTTPTATLNRPEAKAEEPQKWTHPALADDTSLDSEYARFVRGLLNSDDGTIMTFRTLQSIKPKDCVNHVGTVIGERSMGTLEDGDDEDYMLYQYHIHRYNNQL
jgi:hypothetical protein